MIECHPLLRPVVQLAKPVVHAVKSLHPRVVGVRHHVHHHIHRALTAATPPQAVLTVCQRVAGPLVAGGLVLLPPASAVPPAGGVGGFPGAIVPEYGAPAFGPGYAAGPGGPFGYGPGGGYGPAAFGLGAGVLAPGFGGSTPGTSTPATPAPTVVASNTPTTTPTQAGSTSPGTSSPDTPIFVTTGDGPTPSTPGGSSPGGGTPGTPGTPDTPGTPGTPGGSSPGTDTPVDTPEPASVALLAGALAIAIFSRALWFRRSSRD